MFASCTGLTSIPATLLPATTLEMFCYSNMFAYCSGLTSIPATLLPATTLENYFYVEMFAYCTGLNFIYMTVDWFSKTPKQSFMFKGCSKITDNTPYASIPTGWK
jgi:hypothetical protein